MGDTNKFSTKTLSAINNLDGAVIRKKQEYNWRKEMEVFEKRSEFEKDVRSRNVAALHRTSQEEAELAVNSRKRQPNTAIETATEKAPKTQSLKTQQPKTQPKSQQEPQKNNAVESWRKSREAARHQKAPTPEKVEKNWREKKKKRRKRRLKPQLTPKMLNHNKQLINWLIPLRCQLMHQLINQLNFLHLTINQKRKKIQMVP